MKLVSLAFTDTGYALAQSVVSALGGQAERCNRPHSLREWTERYFSSADALLFVGAVGIAVRAIAPYVTSKTSDPAVLVMDEAGRFVIPILSGHLGGANDLAQRISTLCHAVPVLTTATDVHGVFAVDEWAKRQHCAVMHPERIKTVSSAVLRGETIAVYSPWDIRGPLPEHVCRTDAADSCAVQLTVRQTATEALVLVPRILTLGIGCRKGTARETIEAAWDRLQQETGILEAAVAGTATIDIKQHEAGLLEFCAAHNWELQTVAAQELAQVEGEFTPSAFVRQITGVDNVCERSAVYGSGGTLIQKKFAYNGVTLALACAPYDPDWRWRDE
ncbi:MAG: cobalamin biosynthesis protein [Eubacteriales bacterium]|nr:cobalamin biosynthesis protein [Eubacteriales bacterium]